MLNIFKVLNVQMFLSFEIYAFLKKKTVLKDDKKVTYLLVKLKN